LRKNLQYMPLGLHKKYNIEEIVRDKRGYYVFKPNTILGAKPSDSIYGLY